MAIACIKNAPDGIEVVLRDVVKKRGKDANAYAWAGMLADFANQGWVDGKQFSQEAWHEYLKHKYLPDVPEDGITLKGYVKWVELPDGKMEMVGSTTMLTVRGFAQYLERCMAFGATELGIRFTTIRES